MAETKDNTLSIIALVAVVAVVGMVVAFAVSSRASAPAAATPVVVSAPENAAGKMSEYGDGTMACTNIRCSPGYYCWEGECYSAN